eukprot:1491308-Amphidinium_carterae.1
MKPRTGTPHTTHLRGLAAAGRVQVDLFCDGPCTRFCTYSGLATVGRLEPLNGSATLLFSARGARI